MAAPYSFGHFLGKALIFGIPMGLCYLLLSIWIVFLGFHLRRAESRGWTIRILWMVTALVSILSPLAYLLNVFRVDLGLLMSGSYDGTVFYEEHATMALSCLLIGLVGVVLIIGTTWASFLTSRPTFENTNGVS